MKDEEKTKEELLSELAELKRASVERDRAVTALKVSDAKNKAILATAVDAIITIDTKGTVKSLNRSAEKLFGYAVKEVVGNKINMLMPDPYRKEHDKYIQNYLYSGKRKVIGQRREVEALKKDGTVFPIILALSEVRLGPTHFFVGIIRDQTEQKKLEDELRELSETDSLTKIYNRRKFDELLMEEIEKAKRYEHPLSLTMLDIDDFKRINDKHGHVVGDDVIKKVTHVVAKSLRNIDHLARWGGEEFVFVVPETPLEGTLILADRVRKGIEGADFGFTDKVTVSLGVTEYKAGDSPQGLLKRADDAMYRAKEHGGNKVFKS